MIKHTQQRALHRELKSAQFDTKLGAMLAIADETALCLLAFVDQKGVDHAVARLCKRFNAGITPGENKVIQCVAAEMACYFNGKKMTFETPIRLMGTPFQEKVWHALTQIPLGETRAYLDIAKSLDRPTACRAVAQANGANPITIIVPCHRVINAHGALGGYAGGVARKQWLLEHEQNLSF